MSYHSKLCEQSRRAQDQTPDDGLGLLRWGLAMIAVLAVIGWLVA